MILGTFAIPILANEARQVGLFPPVSHLDHAARHRTCQITQITAPPSASIGDLEYCAPARPSCEEPRVEQFIHQENVALYRKQLSEASDTAKRSMLLKLLADEEAKGVPLEPPRTSRRLQSPK
jgi:hypothetical protein